MSYFALHPLLRIDLSPGKVDLKGRVRVLLDIPDVHFFST